MRTQKSLPAAFLFGILVLSLFASLSQAQQEDGKLRKVTSRVTADYPELARQMQLTGTVRVEAVVLPNGRVKSIQVLGGSPVLAKSAVDTIEKWRWEKSSQETKEIIELRFHPADVR